MDHWCIKNVIHAGLALRLASWKHAGDPLIIDRQTNGLSRSFCKMTILILKQSELKLRIAGELKLKDALLCRYSSTSSAQTKHAAV